MSISRKTEAGRTITRPYDGARYLKTEEDMVAYLEAAKEEGDPRLVAIALDNIARARARNLAPPSQQE